MPTPIFQSTRPVRGATDAQTFDGKGPAISIHAPRAGRDLETVRAWICTHYFNPRAPCGARRLLRLRRRLRWHFNPRAPCGARHAVTHTPHWYARFQSTRPVRGATAVTLCNPYSNINFNPRAPCGARLSIFQTFHSPLNFNPRAPCGARLSGLFVLFSRFLFQSTRPVRGATGTLLRTDADGNISIHAPRAGRDSL